MNKMIIQRTIENTGAPVQQEFEAPQRREGKLFSPLRHRPREHKRKLGLEAFGIPKENQESISEYCARHAEHDREDYRDSQEERE